MVVATVTGRGMLHLPAELRRRFRISPGDKVELKATKRGIVIERVPTLMEMFGAYPGHGRRWAEELLEEKKAELAAEERLLEKEDARVGGRRRGAALRV